ncbi:MAG: 50S ribosomal protein L3 N(5)-glutamine methyltransferase [Georgfuchsia sp.]
MESPVDNLFNLRDWLRWAVSRFTEARLFFGHGCDNAYDEAVWLVLHALHLPPDRLDFFMDARLTHAERQSVFNLLNLRISKRIPSAYLTHQAWLGGHDFYVDERVIVPRSYFAELLEHGLSPWVPDDMQIGRALDLCTGSGCLAILMALAFPEASIDAIDLSPAALAVAQRNVEHYCMQEAIELIESDLLAGVGGRRYDLIISNPPYVTTGSMDNLPAEYRHEPALALAAGEDGLDIVRRILASAADHLTPEGILMVEVGHNADLVEAAFPDVPFTWIDTPSSEDKIFLLTRPDLVEYFA